MKATWLLSFSTVANLVLLVAVAYLLAAGDGASRVAIKEAPQPAAKTFQWSQLESNDGPTFASNLRAAGCPETTIRRIMDGDSKNKFPLKRLDDLDEAATPAQAPPSAASPASDTNRFAGKVASWQPATAEERRSVPIAAPIQPDSTLSTVARNGGEVQAGMQTAGASIALPSGNISGASAAAASSSAQDAAPSGRASAYSQGSNASSAAGSGFGLHAQSSSYMPPQATGSTAAESPVSPEDPSSKDAQLYRAKWGWQAFNTAQMQAVLKSQGR